MEKPSIKSESYNERIERELNDLRALCEILGVTILREELFNGVMSVVVDNGEGTEVHIGFPDGTHTGNRKISPAATDAIVKPRVKMGMYGHGIWRRSIDI